MAHEPGALFRAFQEGKKKKVSTMMKRMKASGPVKHTGSFQGKSNALGHGGRAAQLKARGVPGGVIGNLARAAHAAPGQANYHGAKKRKTAAPKDPSLGLAMKKKRKGATTKTQQSGAKGLHETKKKRKTGFAPHEGDAELKCKMCKHCKACKASHPNHKHGKRSKKNDHDADDKAKKKSASK